MNKRIEIQKGKQNNKKGVDVSKKAGRSIDHTISAVQHAQMGVNTLSAQDMLQLQQVAGNRAVSDFVREGGKSETGLAAAGGSVAGVVQRCKDCGDADCQSGEKCSPKASGKKRKYTDGQHGDKKNEQKRLKDEFGVGVTGDTHESEHTVGYEPLSQTGDLPRKKSKRATELENIAPAYQEVKEFHRDHIGTGSRGEVDASGFNARTYRDSQRSLVEAGDVSSAVQLNQLGYAHNKEFQEKKDEKSSQIASRSYDRMVRNMKSMTYADHDENKTVEVDPLQRAEMLLARRAAQTGKWPTAAEISEVKESLGIKDDKAGEEKK